MTCENSSCRPTIGFVIARPGDEIALSFDGMHLGAPPPGMHRTFLLFADGFSKEMDIKSASPDRVDPLPFHKMTHYPYGLPEHYPDTSEYREYERVYNTRVVARPLPPLDAIGGRRIERSAVQRSRWK